MGQGEAGRPGGSLGAPGPFFRRCPPPGLFPFALGGLGQPILAVDGLQPILVLLVEQVGVLAQQDADQLPDVRRPTPGLGQSQGWTDPEASDQRRQQQPDRTRSGT